MSEQAKPGDIIEYVGDVEVIKSRRYIVVERPLYTRNHYNPIHTWVVGKDENLSNREPTFFLSPKEYIIIKSNSSPSLISCQDCKGTGEIMLLTSTVKCRCRK